MPLTYENKKAATPYLLAGLMLFLIVVLGFLFNKERNARITLESNRNSILTIESIEQPGMAEIRARNASNAEIDILIVDRNKNLEALYKLEKATKEKRSKLNVSKKNDIYAAGRKLASMGFTNTVIFRNYSTTKTFRRYTSHP